MSGLGSSPSDVLTFMSAQTSTLNWSKTCSHCVICMTSKLEYDETATEGGITLTEANQNSVSSNLVITFVTLDNRVDFKFTYK